MPIFYFRPGDFSVSKSFTNKIIKNSLLPQLHFKLPNAINSSTLPLGTKLLFKIIGYRELFSESITWIIIREFVLLQSV